MEWAYGQGFDSPHLHQLDNVKGEHIGITSLQGLVVSFFGCIIFSVGEIKNSLPTLNFLQKIGTHIKSRV